MLEIIPSGPAGAPSAAVSCMIQGGGKVSQPFLDLFWTSPPTARFLRRFRSTRPLIQRFGSGPGSNSDVEGGGGRQAKGGRTGHEPTSASCSCA